MARDSGARATLAMRARKADSRCDCKMTAVVKIAPTIKAK
jgi:hypothetical protein